MILGVGIDVVDVNRIGEKKAPEFVRRLLTENELRKYADVLDDRKQNLFLAVRWALKEAIYKSLKTKQLFTDLDIKKVNGLYECFLTHDKSVNLHLSVSYEADAVTAVCVAESLVK